jgi:L-fucose dehydrogenase
MDLQLKDKVIIVSGGAKGIGFGIVKQLAAEEAIPVIIGRNEEDNKSAIGELLKEEMTAHQVVAELTEPLTCKKPSKL